MKKPVSFAFVGFRHSHIISLYELCKKRKDIRVVATCEEDEATRDFLKSSDIYINHSSYQEMLDTVKCDCIAIGDYYGKRGQMIVKALRAGRHIISDKPICTSHIELEEITQLHHDTHQAIGCMLDLRDHPVFQSLRAYIQDGQIGNVQTISFNGQHPLKPRTRPSWYFEEGKHGGTINDIAIHAIDLIPWLTGHAIKKPIAARCWRVADMGQDEFEIGAQLMLELTNGAGVLGDISYLAPDSHGFDHSLYWRFTIHGTRGALEASYNASDISLWQKASRDLVRLPIVHKTTYHFLEDFLAEISGENIPFGLTSASILQASKIALLLQQKAQEQA